MNIVILGEDNKFVNGLRELIETQINCLSVRAFFDKNEFFAKIRLSDVDVCLIEINTRNFSECFQLADGLIEKKPRVKIAFLHGYVAEGWIDKVNIRRIRLISKNSEDMVGDIKKVISGEIVEYVVKKFLTTREAEVLWLMSRGYIQAEIAEKCDISERTVRTHVANIYVKLDVSSQASAVRRGMELCIIPFKFEFSDEF